MVNTHEAKSRLSELIHVAENGEDVILASNGHPVARIVAWQAARPKRMPGSWAGRVQYGSDVVGSDPDVIAAFGDAELSE